MTFKILLSLIAIFAVAPLIISAGVPLILCCAYLAIASFNFFISAVGQPELAVMNINHLKLALTGISITMRGLTANNYHIDISNLHKMVKDHFMWLNATAEKTAENTRGLESELSDINDNLRSIESEIDKLQRGQNKGST